MKRVVAILIRMARLGGSNTGGTWERIALTHCVRTTEDRSYFRSPIPAIRDAECAGILSVEPWTCLEAQAHHPRSLPRAHRFVGYYGSAHMVVNILNVITFETCDQVIHLHFDLPHSKSLSYLVFGVYRSPTMVFSIFPSASSFVVLPTNARISSEMRSR